MCELVTRSGLHIIVTFPTKHHIFNHVKLQMANKLDMTCEYDRIKVQCVTSNPLILLNGIITCLYF